jgi:hypothetical protein
MKLFITTVLMLSSLSVLATDLLEMRDGKRFSCKAKYDVFRSKTNNVYGLSNPTVEVKETTVEIKLDINFYSCDKINGKFQFTKLKNHMKASYTYPHIETGELVTVTRIDKKKEVLSLNEQSQIVSISKIFKSNTQEYVILKIEKSALDINNFPGAQDKGNYTTTLMMRSLTSIISGDTDLGSAYVGSGAYRLFLDLEESKVQFL